MRYSVPARLAATLLVVVTTVCLAHLGTLLVATAMLVGVAWSVRLRRRAWTRTLRGLAFVVLLTLALDAWTTPGHRVLTSVDGSPEMAAIAWLLGTVEGWQRGITVGLRLLNVIGWISVLASTTDALALTDALDRWGRPLARRGWPIGEVIFMLQVALRFVPILSRESDHLARAQLMRGGSTAGAKGGPLRRARTLPMRLVPLLMAAFRRADTLSLALESRGFVPGAPRTSYDVRTAHRPTWPLALAAASVSVGLILFDRVVLA